MSVLLNPVWLCSTVSQQRIGPSLPLLSTWITADVQEAFYEAFQMELDMQLELMTKSPASRGGNANLRNHGLDLLILQAKMHRAQTEITLYTLALENTHANDFSDHSKCKPTSSHPQLMPLKVHKHPGNIISYGLYYPMSYATATWTLTITRTNLAMTLNFGDAVHLSSSQNYSAAQ
jgi:hypothetical protein